MDWVTHVLGSATSLNPEGIAVIGLKYRTCTPYPVGKGIQQIALLDAKRAVRLVRHHAAEWGIDPAKVGVAGYSAGANLAMMLAGNFDNGDPQSADPVERHCSRPAFIAGCSTWHWRETESPFTFRKDTPARLPRPRHQRRHSGPQRQDRRRSHPASERDPDAARSTRRARGPPLFDKDGHGVGNLIPARYQNGFPGAQWPKLLIQWLDNLRTP